LYYRRDHKDNLCKRAAEVFMDTFRVKARYVARARWLLLDKELSRQLRDQFFGLAYWVREAGDPWESRRYHLLASRLWGWDGRTLLAIAKLLPTSVRSLLGRSAVG